MWDFKLGDAFSAMASTAPFVIFRMAVYLGIGLLYVVGMGGGGAIGYGVSSFGDGDGSGVGLGAMFGFVGAAGIAYWIREYVLYIVKAGHIAVLVKHMDGEKLPEGKGQIEYAKDVVKDRFGESSLLFALDQIVKGVIKVITGIVRGIANFIPIPGLDQLAKFFSAIVRMSLTYVDEIILARIVRENSDNAWETGRQSLVLYAQNIKPIIKNAIWLTIFLWLLTLLIFVIIVGPVIGLMSIFPGNLGGWAFLTAFMLAWSLKAALLEPLAIYGLMCVYFKEIEGQEPDPEWDERLSKASKKFVELKDRAASAMGFGGGDSGDKAPVAPQ